MMLDKFFNIISGALLASGIFISCSQQEKKSLPTINEFIADSIYMPVSLADHFESRVKEVEEMPEGDEIVMFVKSNDFKAYFYNMTTEIYIDSIPLVEYANDYIDSYP
jgi:hypothetical protein